MSLFEDVLTGTLRAPDVRVLGLGTLESANHGVQCDCTLLASACHVSAEAITFEFCQRVLAQHWTLRCRHGDPGGASLRDCRLPALGPLDRVGGILVQGLRSP
jgi:hypothetical protein